MVFKEFAAKQAAKHLLPLIGKASDKNFDRLLKIIRTAAPNEFARSIIDAISTMHTEHHPTVEVLRKLFRQTSPHVRERLLNSLLIKHHWYGSMRRNEMRSQGLAVPGVFLISPTMRCNLHCSGCYAATYDKKDDLEFEVIDRVFTEAEDLGIFWVTILGGEPFIRQDMLELYKKHNDIFFQVFTNGTLVDKEMAKKVAELGNILIIFSLEGFEEETDARRGKGAFQKVMQGMDNLREVGMPYGFSLMVTRYNVDTIISEEFNDMLVKKDCLIGWNFLYLPVGINPDISLMPTVEQRELMRVKGPRYIRTKKPLFTIDFWNDAPHMGGCIAGARHFFHINSRGDAEPCIFIHLATDNVHDKTLKEIINSPFFKAFRDRQPYCANLLRPCTIMDHPQILRDICAETHPYTTDGPACSLISNPIRDHLDRYSLDLAKIMDPVWAEEFADWHFTGSIVPSRFAPSDVTESPTKPPS